MKLALFIAFGSTIVADHLKSNSREEAWEDETMLWALGIIDRYTGWSDGFPSVGKSAETNVTAFRQFCVSSDKV